MRATGWIFLSLTLLWGLAHAAAPSAPPAPSAPAQAITFGDKFPGGVFENVNAGVGGPASINLGEVIGRKPIVFCMWSMGHHRSEQVFQELQALVQEVGPQKVALYGVLPEGSTKDRDGVRQRLQEMKIAVPVLLDSNYKFVYGLGVLRPPFIAVLDKDGMLRLGGGSSLKQTLEYKMTLEDGIRRVAATGSLGTYGMLRDYYPAVEMVAALVGREPVAPAADVELGVGDAVRVASDDGTEIGLDAEIGPRVVEAEHDVGLAAVTIRHPEFEQHRTVVHDPGVFAR